MIRVEISTTSSDMSSRLTKKTTISENLTCP